MTDIEYNGRKIVRVNVQNESTGETLIFRNQDEEKKKAEEAKNKKIGKVKGSALEKMLTDAGQNVDAFLKYYKVEAIEDLTEEQHFIIVNSLKKKLAEKEKNGDKGKA